MYPNTVAFVNQKGGVGKTTSAVNIAAILAQEHDCRVLLIDADPQGHATHHLGFDRDSLLGLDGALFRKSNIPSLATPTSIEGLSLLGAPDYDTGVQLLGLPAMEMRLRKAIAAFPRAFDHIIIDGGPNHDALLYNVLAAANSYVVPIYYEGLSVNGLAQLQETAEEMKELNPSLSFLGLLPCRVRKNLRLTKSIESMLRQGYFTILAPCIKDRVQLAEAASSGQPIIQYNPQGPSADEYRAITQELFNAKK